MQAASGSKTRTGLEDIFVPKYSTFTWALEPVLERCGFSIREALYSQSGTFADSLCERVAPPPEA